MDYREVLDFWFLPPASEGYGAPRDAWFRKSDAFDREIAARFGAALTQAQAGGLIEWDAAGPEGRLARIIVLDQFSRNALRDTPGAFAGDALALQAACRLVDAGEDGALLPVQRWFAYMPFEHAEDLAMQQRSVDLFTALAAQAAGFAGVLDYAVRHRDVIERFGRFPHRNAILGRASTSQEQDYLRQPGSGF